MLEIFVKSILKWMGVYPQSKSYKARVVDKPVVFEAKTRLLNDLKLEGDIQNLAHKLDVYLRYLQETQKRRKKSKKTSSSVVS